MHSSEFYIQLPPTCSGHSCGHLQGGNANDKKLKDDAIIEVTEQIQDIQDRQCTVQTT
jgi:hypothetical protein